MSQVYDTSFKSPPPPPPSPTTATYPAEASQFNANPTASNRVSVIVRREDALKANASAAHAPTPTTPAFSNRVSVIVWNHAKKGGSGPDASPKVSVAHTWTSSSAQIHPPQAHQLKPGSNLQAPPIFTHQQGLFPNVVQGTSTWTPCAVPLLPHGSVIRTNVPLVPPNGIIPAQILPLKRKAGESDHATSSESVKSRKVEVVMYTPCMISKEAAKVFLNLMFPIPITVLNSGKFQAWALTPQDLEYQLILKYIDNSQVHGFQVKVKDILRIKRVGEVDFCFDPRKSAQEQLRMMLWHGTLCFNLPSILEHGFKCPDFRSQLFGRGIYFSDRVSKSANYSGMFDRFLLLCDVYLGKMCRVEGPRKCFTRAPTVTMNTGQIVEYNSVLGPGRYVPDSYEEVVINGCMWPLGRTIQAPGPDGLFAYLNFNEYVTYNPEMIQVKYLIRWEQG